MNAFVLVTFYKGWKHPHKKIEQNIFIKFFAYSFLFWILRTHFPMSKMIIEQLQKTSVALKEKSKGIGAISWRVSIFWYECKTIENNPWQSVYIYGMFIGFNPSAARHLSSLSIKYTQ